MIRKVYLLILIFTVILRSYCDAENSYKLLLIDNSPVTTGAKVTLNATVVNHNGVCIPDTYTFAYEDDAMPVHRFKTQIKSCEAIFYIPFDDKNGPSVYRYKVDVSREIMPFINLPIVNDRKKLIITENLNGQLQLIQNNNTVGKNSAQFSYISTGYETVQKIVLNQADYDYLNSTANNTLVHWFIDCIYQGNSTDFSLISNYTKPDVEHEILGIVVASMKSNNTNTTTTTPIVTISNTNFSLNSTLSNKSNIKLSHLPINSTNNAICKKINKLSLLMSAVQINANQKYGYFSRSILVKEPISNIKSEGKVWIKEGDLLKLQVSCNGSGPFKYCAHYGEGPYNVTGNETCLWERDLLSCQMHFQHLFREPTNYTLVIILVNDVSKVVTPIGINIYKVKKQPQISVIVVPVTFSSIAIIMIVFGIAYYFQNRSRYMVEVADFDFANNSDMECKTFMERLRDAISQAINRTQDYSEYDGSEEQIGGLATPQNQKYGSMQ